MELKVGMFVRTKEGIIDKVIIDYNGHCASPNCEHKHISCAKNYYNEDEVVKASYNIIDILEDGDIISFYEDIDNYKKEYVIKIVDIITFDEVVDKIKNGNIRLVSILTKEQFEQMNYRIGEQRCNRVIKEEQK